MNDSKKGLIDFFRDMFKAPVLNLIILIGAFFIILSFITIEGGFSNFSFSVNYLNIYLLIAGGVFSISGITLFIVERATYLSIDGKDIEKGRAKINFGETTIGIEIGDKEKISDITKNENSAIVIPTDKNFSKESIISKKSSVGLMEHSEEESKKEEIMEDINRELAKSPSSRKIGEDKFEQSTTIILPPKNNLNNSRVIITASDKDENDKESISSIISKSIQHIIELAKNENIEKLIIPLLSGDENEDINDVLLSMLVSLRSSLKGYGIKDIKILMNKEQAKKVHKILI